MVFNSSMADGMLALTWNNHSSTFSKTISSLRIKEQYTDVTITCEGKFYQVHKFVLATCSEYFEKIFQETPCKHPVVVLRDVSCDELEALLNYMYVGSVSVAQNDLARLIKVAELFQIKGLAVPDDPPPTSKCSDGDSGVTNSEGREAGSDSYSVRGKSQELRRNSPYTKTKNLRDNDSDFSDPSPKRTKTHNTTSGTGSKSNEQADQPSIDERLPFGMNVKEETEDLPEHDVEDNQNSSIEALYLTKDEPDASQDENPLSHEDAQLGPPYETHDIPPDDPSISQPGLSQHSFTEELLSLPGPSDAQQWYSEGDSSSSLPLGKGGVVDQNSQMLETSQQPHRMMETVTMTSKEGSGKQVKLHECLVCSFTTMRKFDMVRHMAVHTGERPYACVYCPASFSLKGNLKTHIRIHTGEKPFACTYCSYRAAQKQALKAHLVNKHSKNS